MAEPIRKSAKLAAIDVRLATAPDSEVNGLFPVHGDSHGGGHRMLIGGGDDREAGDARMMREVLGRVVRGAVEAERDARMVADQPHRQAGERDVGADLLAAQ